MNDREWGFKTRAIHAGGGPDASTGARNVPIYQTTSFVFEDTRDAADMFALQKFGSIYTRISNPTINAFEERMASLEGGIGSVATSSGMSAEFLTAAALASSGDSFVTSSAIYGGTHTMFDVSLGRFGIEARFVEGDAPESFDVAIDDTTKFLYTEIVGNPSGAVADVSVLAAVAHSHDIPLVIDATFATPYLCRPIDFGADIVLHSATKFIGGHGNSIGGVVTESGRFNWGNGRFPEMTEPVATYNGLKYWENFGEYAFCTKLRSEQLRDLGASLAPMNAFLLLQGLETLPFRMDAHVANAKTVASFLEKHSEVSWVNYAGLESSPHYEIANKYMPKGPGAIFTFGVKGGREAGSKFIDSLELISHLANVGDVRSLVIHPASTTHQQLSDEDLASGGVSADMVRLSVGLEDVDDILWDLDQALMKASS